MKGFLFAQPIEWPRGVRGAGNGFGSNESGLIVQGVLTPLLPMLVAWV